MISTTRVTEKILEKRPFLQEALRKGIVNNAKLAENLLPQVESELNKKVKFSAVNMAIRRLAEKLENMQANTKYFSSSDLTVRSDLFMLNVNKDEKSLAKIKDIYNKIETKQGDFLTITQGLQEIMIITNSKYSDKILPMFSKSHSKHMGNLSAVTLRLPEDAIQIPGIIFIATRAMAWENVNIVDVVSTFTELTFLVEENETAVAFECLKRMIKEHH